MKKLTAMLLSLVMCVSLLAIPAQAADTPDSGDPDSIVIGEGLTKPGQDDPDEPGDDDPDEPGNPDPQRALPAPRDDLPGHA